MTSQLSLGVDSLTAPAGRRDTRESIALPLECSSLLLHPERFGELLLLEFTTKFDVDAAGEHSRRPGTGAVAGISGMREREGGAEESSVHLYYFDESTLTVIKGNKEYQGRREVLARPFLVVSMQEDTDSSHARHLECGAVTAEDSATSALTAGTVCVVHSVIREKIIFDSNPVYHFT